METPLFDGQQRAAGGSQELDRQPRQFFGQVHVKLDRRPGHPGGDQLGEMCSGRGVEQGCATGSGRACAAAVRRHHCGGRPNSVAARRAASTAGSPSTVPASSVGRASARHRWVRGAGRSRDASSAQRPRREPPYSSRGSLAGERVVPGGEGRRWPQFRGGLGGLAQEQPQQRLGAVEAEGGDRVAVADVRADPIRQPVTALAGQDHRHPPVQVVRSGVEGVPDQPGLPLHPVALIGRCFALGPAPVGREAMIRTWSAFLTSAAHPQRPVLPPLGLGRVEACIDPVAPQKQPQIPDRIDVRLGLVGIRQEHAHRSARHIACLLPAA